MEKEKAENLASNKENLEKLEERERVITLLHDFYQERQKNMPAHKEITELAENLKGLFEKTNDYLKKYGYKRGRVFEEYFNNKKDYKTLLMRRWEDDEKGKSKNAGRFLGTSGSLTTILKNEDPDEQDRTDIEDLIQEINKTEETLDEKVKELWEIREKITKEFLNFPEFFRWKNGQFGRYWEGIEKKIYDLGGYIYIKNEVETEKGTEQNNLFFIFDTFEGNFEIGINQLKKRLSITEEELKGIKGLEWNAEDKEKLEQLAEETEKYKEKAGQIAESFLGIKETFEFDERSTEIIKDEMLRAFVKARYKEIGLPRVHKARVVQEIMNRTFNF